MAKRLKQNFMVSFPHGDETVQITGQACRTLVALIKHPNGVTPGDISVWGWGYRASEYVRNLRYKYGLDIETLKETHFGPDGRGWHGRYILHTPVELLENEGQDNGCSDY